jgi:hypothetical protein
VRKGGGGAHLNNRDDEAAVDDELRESGRPKVAVAAVPQDETALRGVGRGGVGCGVGWA